MINLAPLRYARVLSKDRGPIEKIEYRRIQVAGEPVYQANACLSPWLNLDRMPVRVFADVDGCGTHVSAMLARSMAVSEAIERWALHYLNQAGLRTGNGLEEDNSTTGIAAFPGLWKWQARRRARSEAAERFCLAHWWNGDLETRTLPAWKPGIQGVEIENPVSRDRVILTWSQSDKGFYVYGFGAAGRLKQARWKAVVEMERARVALQAFYLENPGFELDDLSTLDNLHERRVVYFSHPEGHREFREHLGRQARGGIPSGSIKPVIDCALNGPWNRYATVWRVLFPMPNREILERHPAAFYW
jgi:hypothetical protein